jgi:undecaprenyl-diphosphatase
LNHSEGNCRPAAQFIIAEIEEVPRTTFLRREARLLAAFVVVATSFVAVTRLGSEVREDGTSSFDRWLLLALRRPGDLTDPVGPAWLKAAEIDITALGSGTVLTLLTLLSLGYLAASRKWIDAGMVAAATLSGSVLGNLLKIGFARTRPSIVPHLVDVHSLSYPSAHATNSAVVFLTLGALLARAQRTRWTRIYVVAVGVLLTVLIGFSRVFVGVHWPTDVIAGWAVGGSWALLWWAVSKRVVHSGPSVPLDTCRPPSTDGEERTTETEVDNSDADSL